MRSRSRTATCCSCTIWATRTAGAAWIARVSSKRRSSVEYSCSLRRGPNVNRPTSSPWLTNGTAIFTSAIFMACKAGESRLSLSISTAPEVLRKYAMMGSLGAMSNAGVSTGSERATVVSCLACTAFLLRQLHLWRKDCNSVFSIYALRQTSVFPHLMFLFLLLLYPLSVSQALRDTLRKTFINANVLYRVELQVIETQSTVDVTGLTYLRLGALEPRTNNCPLRITWRVGRWGSAMRCSRSSVAVLPISEVGWAMRVIAGCTSNAYV